MRDGHLQEQYSGDYAPFWLRNLLNGIADPLPQHKQMEGMQQPFRVVEGVHSSSCMRDLPGHIQICIEGEHGAFDFILSAPGGLEFHDYQPFHHQWIARKLISNPESGTTLQLTSTDANLAWPLVRSGNTKGSVRVFLGIGPDGKVREVWPAGSDNGEIEDFARQKIKDWQFSPYLLNGQAVAVSTYWTMPFETKIGIPLPELSDAEVRKLASNMVEPVFAPGTAKPGQELRVSIAVDEQGKLTGVGNPGGLGQSFMAIYAAVSQWKFKPLVQDGKAQYFHAWLVFKVR
jgi:hypothetical protein